MHSNRRNRRVCAKVRPAITNTAHSYCMYVPDFTVMGCRWVNFLGCTTSIQNSNCQISSQGNVYYDEWVFFLVTFLTTSAIFVFFPSPPSLSASALWLYLLRSPPPQPPLLLFYYYYYYYHYSVDLDLSFCVLFILMYVGLCVYFFSLVTADHVISSVQAELLCHTRVKNGFSFAHINLRICVRNSVRFFSLVSGRLCHYLLRNVQSAPCYFFFGFLIIVTSTTTEFG